MHVPLPSESVKLLGGSECTQLRRGCRELGWPCQLHMVGTTRCYLSQTPDCRSQLSRRWGNGGSVTACADVVVVTMRSM